MVMKKVLPLVLALAFLVTAFAEVSAKVQLYVHHKKVKAKLVSKGEQYYGPLSIVEEALGCRIKVDPSTSAVAVNDEAVEGKAFVQDGETFVPLKTIAKKLGFNYCFNKGTEMLDINKLSAGQSTDSSAGKTAEATPGTTPPNPGANPGNAGGQEYNNFTPPPDNGSVPAGQQGQQGQQQPSGSEELLWYDSLGAALSVAEGNKTVIALFYMKDETNIQFYNDTLLGDQVKSLLVDMIRATVDGEAKANSAVLSKYGIKTFPSLLLLNRQGIVLGRLEGAKPANEVAEFIRTSLRKR